MWYYFLFSDKSILADFFFKWDKEKSAKLCELEILKILTQLNCPEPDLFKLKMKKWRHFLKFHQKLTKQSDLIFLILCIFDLLLDTCFWTGIKCLDWDCTKISQPIIFWVGAFKGNLKKPWNYFLKLLVRLNPVCRAITNPMDTQSSCYPPCPHLLI